MGVHTKWGIDSIACHAIAIWGGGGGGGGGASLHPPLDGTSQNCPARTYDVDYTKHVCVRLKNGRKEVFTITISKCSHNYCVHLSHYAIVAITKELKHIYVRNYHRTAVSIRSKLFYVELQQAQVYVFIFCRLICTDPHFDVISGGGWEGHTEPRRGVEGTAGRCASSGIPKCAIGFTIAKVVISNE